MRPSSNKDHALDSGLFGGGFKGGGAAGRFVDILQTLGSEMEEGDVSIHGDWDWRFSDEAMRACANKPFK
jgi:hypothetical protein